MELCSFPSSGLSLQSWYDWLASQVYLTKAKADTSLRGVASEMASSSEVACFELFVDFQHDETLQLHLLRRGLKGTLQLSKFIDKHPSPANYHLRKIVNQIATFVGGRMRRYVSRLSVLLCGAILITKLIVPLFFLGGFSIYSDPRDMERYASKISRSLSGCPNGILADQAILFRPENYRYIEPPNFDADWQSKERWLSE